MTEKEPKWGVWEEIKPTYLSPRECEELESAETVLACQLKPIFVIVELECEEKPEVYLVRESRDVWIKCELKDHDMLFFFSNQDEIKRKLTTVKPSIIKLIISEEDRFTEDYRFEFDDEYVFHAYLKKEVQFPPLIFPPWIDDYLLPEYLPEAEFGPHPMFRTDGPEGEPSFETKVERVKGEIMTIVKDYLESEAATQVLTERFTTIMDLLIQLNEGQISIETFLYEWIQIQKKFLGVIRE